MNIHFNINKQRAIEALVWIIQRGEANLYNVIKILFAAEKYRLNKYGGPITGDRYVAMEFGTVPSWTYNAAKHPLPEYGFSKDGDFLHLSQGRKHDPNMFAAADIEALEHGFAEYAGKKFSAVMRKNHRERAWQKAIERNPGKKAPKILFEDMITGKKWLVAHLLENAPYCVI